VSWRYLLIDNDNTLMDFSAAEHAAVRETLAQYGLPCGEEEAALYARINKSCWEALERGETTRERLKHDRYAMLLRALGRDDSIADEVSAAYEENLSHHAELMPGALELLQRVKPMMKIALVSNGFSRIQRGRLSVSPIAAYLDAVAISEECGHTKPDPELAEDALRMLGCEDRREAVFLGDSASADIACAAAAGIESIHFSPSGRYCESADYGVRSCDEAA